MDIPVQIKTKYKKIGDTMVPTLRISVLQDIHLRAGAALVINSKSKETAFIDHTGFDNVPITNFSS